MLPPVGMLENVFRGSGKFLQKVAALDLRDRSCRVSSGRSKRKQMNIYSVMADQDFCYLKVGTNNSNNLIRGGVCIFQWAILHVFKVSLPFGFTWQVCSTVLLPLSLIEKKGVGKI